MSEINDQNGHILKVLIIGPSHSVIISTNQIKVHLLLGEILIAHNLSL